MIMKILLSLLLGTCLLAACSPKYDWREIHGSTAPFVLAFPAKPNSETRATQLGNIKLEMTMHSVRIEAITFAAGSAALPDATQAQNALPLLKAALLANIGGQITSENTSANGDVQLEAKGSQNQHGTVQPLQLQARFLTRGKYLYQLVIMGPPDKLAREQSDTFFTSFKAE
jgi:hypothetical protein